MMNDKEIFIGFVEANKSGNKRKRYQEIRNRDYLGQAKKTYEIGDYDNAWILAQKAILFDGDGVSGECMMAGMVQNGTRKIDLDRIKEEPDIVVEGNKAKTTVYVENKTGICETTAAILVGTAKRFQSAIEFVAKGKKADAKSILFVEALGMMKGTKLDIQAEGKDAEEAVRNLGKLILNRFCEE